MTSVVEPDVLLLEALADPARLAIVRSLAADGPACARDLGKRCGARAQSTISHHLRVLREAGWIDGQRRGTWIWYAIRPEAQARLERVARTVGLRGPITAPGVTEPPAMPASTARPGWRQW